jgi:hypothetical protein
MDWMVPLATGFRLRTREAVERVRVAWREGAARKPDDET